MTKTKKANKSSKKTVKKEKIEVPELEFMLNLCETQVNFEVDYHKSIIEWRFEKQGRNLSIEMGAFVEDWNAYTNLFANLAHKDFVKQALFDDPAQLNALLKVLGTNRLLFDFIIVECTIFWEDENGSSEFVRYSGLPLTVNGRKHLEDEINGNSETVSPEAANKGTA